MQSYTEVGGRILLRPGEGAQTKDRLGGIEKAGLALEWKVGKEGELVPARLIMTLPTLCSPVASVHEKFVLHRAGTNA